MGKLLPTGSALRVRSHDAFEHWYQRWEPYLDRLEEFASNFGGTYVQHLDGAFIALGGAVAALAVLALI